MTRIKRPRDARPRVPPRQVTAESLGLEPELYAAVLRYLFDRPVPPVHGQEWYRKPDEPAFEATPLQWTRLQTVLFSNADQDLDGYSDEQVGMGLYHLMSGDASGVPFAAIDASVPMAEGLRMMRALPSLWRQCIGPRLAQVRAPIGSQEGGRLGFVCYMWFDVWPTFHNVRHLPPWSDALWQVLKQMLALPCRAVQISALHGIGHHVDDLPSAGIDIAVRAFVRRLGEGDEELKRYAESARLGRVQ